MRSRHRTCLDLLWLAASCWSGELQRPGVKCYRLEWKKLFRQLHSNQCAATLECRDQSELPSKNSSLARVYQAACYTNKDLTAFSGWMEHPTRVQRCLWPESGDASRRSFKLLKPLNTEGLKPCGDFTRNSGGGWQAWWQKSPRHVNTFRMREKFECRERKKILFFSLKIYFVSFNLISLQKRNKSLANWWK